MSDTFCIVVACVTGFSARAGLPCPETKLTPFSQRLKNADFCMMKSESQLDLAILSFGLRKFLMRPTFHTYRLVAGVVKIFMFNDKYYENLGQLL